MVRKLKKIDPATYSRFRREKKCFEPDHVKKLEVYAKEASALNGEISSLKEELKLMRESTVDKALSEEQEKTAFHKGLHEGHAEAEERLRKERRCFNKIHMFVENKTPMNLNLGEVLLLFAKMGRSSLLGGMGAISGRVTVMVPNDMNVMRMTDQQSFELGATFFKDATVKIERKDEPEKKGGP